MHDAPLIAEVIDSLLEKVRELEAAAQRLRAVADPSMESLLVTVGALLQQARRLEQLAPAYRAERARRHRVLIVDDDQEACDLVRSVLEVRGYDMHEAAAGEAGLLRMMGEEWDVVLLDIFLPGMNGLEVMRNIYKTRPTLSRHVILFTSAAEDPAIREFAEDAGVPLLGKPFSIQRLVEVVEESLARKEAPSGR